MLTKSLYRLYCILRRLWLRYISSSVIHPFIVWLHDLKICYSIMRKHLHEISSIVLCSAAQLLLWLNRHYCNNRQICSELEPVMLQFSTYSITLFSTTCFLAYYVWSSWNCSSILLNVIVTLLEVILFKTEFI